MKKILNESKHDNLIKEVIDNKLTDFYWKNNLDKNQPYFSENWEKKIINKIKNELSGFKQYNDEDFKNLVDNRILLWWNELYYDKNVKYWVLWTFPWRKTLRFSELLRQYIKEKKIVFINIENKKRQIPERPSLYYCDIKNGNSMREDISNIFDHEVKDIFSIIEEINKLLNGKVWKGKVWKDFDIIEENLGNLLVNLYKAQLLFCKNCNIWFSDWVSACFCDPDSSTDGNSKKKSWEKTAKRLPIYYNNIKTLPWNNYVVIINHKDYKADIKNCNLKALYFWWWKQDSWEIWFYEKRNLFKKMEKTKKEMWEKWNELKPNKRMFKSEWTIYRIKNEKGGYSYSLECFEYTPKNAIKIIYTGSTSGSNWARKMVVEDSHNKLKKLISTK